MKKSMTLCVAAVMLLALCACGARTEPETVRSPYDGLIACLEAGDYDGARAMIDAMEKNKEPLETEIAETLENYLVCVCVRVCVSVDM